MERSGWVRGKKWIGASNSNGQIGKRESAGAFGASSWELVAWQEWNFRLFWRPPEWMTGEQLSASFARLQRQFERGNTAFCSDFGLNQSNRLP
jgi:hypothetical protein